MKITESKIRQIIREEARRVLREGSFPEEIEAVYGKAPPERSHRSARGSSEDNLRDFLLGLLGGGIKHRDEAQVIIDMIYGLCDKWAQEDPETVFEPDAEEVWQKLQDEYDDYAMLNMIEGDMDTFDRLVNAFIKDTCGKADLERGHMPSIGRRR
jgi:hypothetical protein